MSWPLNRNIQISSSLENLCCQNISYCSNPKYGYNKDFRSIKIKHEVKKYAISYNNDKKRCNFDTSLLLTVFQCKLIQKPNKDEWMKEKKQTKTWWINPSDRQQQSDGNLKKLPKQGGHFIWMCFKFSKKSKWAHICIHYIQHKTIAREESEEESEEETGEGEQSRTERV